MYTFTKDCKVSISVQTFKDFLSLKEKQDSSKAVWTLLNKVVLRHFEPLGSSELLVGSSKLEYSRIREEENYQAYGFTVKPVKIMPYFGLLIELTALKETFIIMAAEDFKSLMVGGERDAT